MWLGFHETIGGCGDGTGGAGSTWGTAVGLAVLREGWDRGREATGRVVPRWTQRQEVSHQVLHGFHIW